MTILGSTKLGTTITGHAELVNLAKEQAELNADIDAITVEDEIVERFIQCATHAMPYFSVSYLGVRYKSFYKTKTFQTKFFIIKLSISKY